MERPAIELVQKIADRFVELAEAEKSVVSKRRQYPAFDDLDRGFHLGFVFRLSDPGRNDHRTVVTGHIQIGRIDVRFIEAGMFDPGFGVVGHQHFGNTGKECKCTAVSSDPVGKRLGPGRFGIGVV